MCLSSVSEIKREMNKEEEPLAELMFAWFYCIQRATTLQTSGTSHRMPQVRNRRDITCVAVMTGFERTIPTTVCSTCTTTTVYYLYNTPVVCNTCTTTTKQQVWMLSSRHLSVVSTVKKRLHSVNLEIDF